MNLPFSTEQFMDLFKNFNESIFPLQIVNYILAIVVLISIFRKNKFSSVVVSSYLSYIWLFMGIVYHFIFFSTINSAALTFGIFYIILSILIAYHGIIKKSLHFEIRNDFRSIVSLFLIFYSMILYSLIGFASGHFYPYAPVFGVAPCPNTIFTFGIILLHRGKIKPCIIVIPFLWSLIGFVAALKLGIYEDIGLLLSGIITVVLIILNYRKSKVL